MCCSMLPQNSCTQRVCDLIAIWLENLFLISWQRRWIHPNVQNSPHMEWWVLKEIHLSPIQLLIPASAKYSSVLIVTNLASFGTFLRRFTCTLPLEMILTATNHIYILKFTPTHLFWCRVSRSHLSAFSFHINSNHVAKLSLVGREYSNHTWDLKWYLCTCQFSLICVFIKGFCKAN